MAPRITHGTTGPAGGAARSKPGVPISSRGRRAPSIADWLASAEGAEHLAREERRRAVAELFVPEEPEAEEDPDRTPGRGAAGFMIFSLAVWLLLAGTWALGALKDSIAADADLSPYYEERP